MATTSPTTDREIRVARVIDAPRERVFDAFTDAKHIGAWWGPNGFTTTTSEMDVRPGGTWRYVMHGPDGTNYPNLVRYTEVRRPERIAYDHTDGADPPEIAFQTVVEFEDRGGKTEVTLTAIFATAEMCRRQVEEVGAIEGGQQTLGRLAAFVESQ